MNEERNELTTDEMAEGTPSPATTDDETEQPTDVPSAAREREAGPDEEAAPAADAGDEQPMPLFSADEGEGFRGRWSEIQAGFVDQPRKMVEEADRLVADLMQRLTAQFAEERGRLESQWESNDDVSTEDLRVTLTRYRSFFERLLKA